MASDMAADEAPGQEEAPLDDSLKAYALSRAEVNSLRTFEDEGSDISSSEILSMLSSELQPAAVMEELGYACAVDSTRCKELLGLFMPLSEKNVAMIIGMVCRTHVGLDDVHGAYSALSSVLFSYVGDASWISSWNQDALIDALKELAPNLDWLHVIENLDHEGLFVSDQKALSLLVSFHTKMCQEEFPVQAICGSVWKNAEGQISLLRQAVVASPEVISFVGSHRKQNLLEGFQKLVHSGSANHAWLSIDLLETLCRLAESGHAEAVRSVLDFPSKNCPELLLAGLAQVETEWNLIQNEYFALLFPSYLGGNQHANLVMHQLWVLNPETVIQAIVDIHSKDPSTIAKVMDMCEQDTKILDGILRGSPAYFAIDLAALASRRDSLSLEKWLLENFSVHQDLFFQACLNFLRERLQVDGANAQPGVAPRMGLSLETTATFFKALQSFVGKLSSRELAEEMRRVHQAAVRANPRLLSVAAAEQTPTELFSSDIEEEANSYFQKIYQNQLTVDAIVEMLEKFNESSDIREQHVFSCMIHSLFDEYRFFPRYPERELKITAVLFGKLISHQLVSCITLGVALRYVLDSLRKPPDSRMFAFGLTALEQFRSRLEEWPQYCNHILQIAHMREGHPDLVEYIERCLARSTGDASSNEHQPALTEHPQSSEVPQATNTNVVQNTSATQQEERPRSAGASSLVAARSVPASSHFGSQLYDALRGQQKAPQNPQAAATQNFQKPSRTTSVPVPRSTPGFGSAINIETLVAAAERRDPIENPSQEVEDKVAFIINNISPTTFESKAKEFLEVVKEKYYAWFAQYIVMKRASIEPNQHDRYLKFLDKLNSPSLNQQILNATYQNCKVLLGSELIKSSSEERSLLKNLGSWLGKLTIGRNKVLKAKEIDPKSLIIEAYEKGLMIAVIPFTSKILEPCQTSAVYQPPNPWTMGILGLLAEIYALPSLKMNLKFDIEVLFKNLNVDMKDVKSATLVKGRARELEGNPDFSNKDVHISQPPPTTDIITSLNQVDFIDMPVPPHPTNTSQQVTHIHTNSSQEEEKVIPFGGDRKSLSVPYSSGQASGTFPLLNSYLILNPRLGQQLHMQLQRITPTAIERAIREIIAPVVERSVTIACMTTKELIQKDFALEADDRSTVNSANLMVASLAGSLAHVTCKEPLRVAMANHIRQSLTAHIASASDLDQTVHVLTNDNLDLACAVIEKAATEKALRDLEETMGPLLMTKRSHRDALLQAYTQGPLSRLPEALRPKPGRLSPAQQRVYEDFSRLPWQNQQTSQAPSAAPVTAQSRGNYNSVFTTSHSAPGMSQPSDLTSDDLDVRTPSPTSFSDAGGRHPDTMSDSAQTLADGAGSEMLLPGKLLPNTEPSGHVPSEACLSIGDAVENYNVIAQKLDAAILRTSAATYSTLPPDHEMRALITDIQDLISQSLSREDAAIAIAQKVFQRLYEKTGSSLQVSTQLAILEAIRDVCKHVVKELTSLVILSDEERKFNRDIVVALVRSELINLSDFLPKLMESRNPAATELAVHIVKTVQEGGLSGAELRPLDLIKDRLLKDKKHPLVKAIHRESDPPGLREQVVSLFDEWARIYNAPGANEKAYAGFISQLAQSGLLKGDDVTERFFRILTELAVAHSLDTASPNLIFAAVDLYAKLVVLLLKYYAVEPATNKVTLLNKILSVTVRVIQRDADEKKTAFQPRPYFRLFFTWFMDFNTPDSSLDFSNLPIQISFSNALYMLQPLNVPGCSFIWLELISHRMFMPKQLLSNSQKGWAYYQRLLVSLFRFMDPYLRNTELSDPIRLLYKGTLRVLLVLLHDFPEFLCDFHFSFCDVIPPTCIQMRNLILSAFPRNMRLPDPFTPNLKVDLLPEISHPPRILSDFEYALKAKGLKAEVDEYLKTRQSLSMFLVDLKQRLMLPHNEAIASGTHYNVPLINSLVLYIGVQAIEQLSKTTPQLAVPTAPITHSAPMDIFQKLILELDTEGRYLFLNAIANQLRYPNNHTHYFSCVLLYLFAEANQEIIQEQITRVLLERLIVNRPHPWGLLITFIELIKNPRYSFWSHNFTRCAPEIERLFDSVARSCMGPPIKSTEDDLASGLGSEGIKG